MVHTPNSFVQSPVFAVDAAASDAVTVTGTIAAAALRPSSFDRVASNSPARLPDSPTRLNNSEVQESTGSQSPVSVERLKGAYFHAVQSLGIESNNDDDAGTGFDNGLVDWQRPAAACGDGAQWKIVQDQIGTMTREFTRLREEVDSLRFASSRVEGRQTESTMQWSLAQAEVAREIMAVMTQMSEKQVRLKKAHEDSVKRIHSDVQQWQGTVQKRDTEVERRLEVLRRDLEQETKALQLRDSEAEQQLVVLRRALEQEARDREAFVSDEIRKFCALELTTKASQLTATCHEVSLNASRLQEKMETDMGQLRQTLKQEMGEIKQSSTQEIEQLMRLLGTDMEQSKQSTAQEMEQLKQSLGTDMDQLKQSLGTDMGQFRHTLAIEMGQLQQRVEQDMAQLKQSTEQQICDRRNSDARYAALSTVSSDLQSCHARLQQELSQASSDHKADLGRIQEMLRAHSADIAEQNAQLREERALRTASQCEIDLRMREEIGTALATQKNIGDEARCEMEIKLRHQIENAVQQILKEEAKPAPLNLRNLSANVLEQAKQLGSDYSAVGPTIVPAAASGQGRASYLDPSSISREVAVSGGHRPVTPRTSQLSLSASTLHAPAPAGSLRAPLPASGDCEHSESSGRRVLSASRPPAGAWVATQMSSVRAPTPRGQPVGVSSPAVPSLAQQVPWPSVSHGSASSQATLAGPMIEPSRGPASIQRAVVPVRQQSMPGRLS